MAARNRGQTGKPLRTPFYPTLEEAGITFYRSQFVLVVSPGGGGKSLLIGNLVVKWDVPTLAFLLDQDQSTASARFAATELDEPFTDLKEHLHDPKVGKVLAGMGNIQTDFKAEQMDDVLRQLDAYIERYGQPPQVMVIDNLGNMTSGYDDEWSALKALTLEFDLLARQYEMLVIGAHHTRDEPTTEPLPRSAILGKISQYPRLILSIAFNTYDQVYKLAAVKNSSGPSDVMAVSPLAFMANPANMQVTELPRERKPNAAAEAMARLRGEA